MTVLTDRWRLPWVAERAESWCAASAGAGETRVGEAARALLLRTTWHAQRLVSWTPHLRQFQARARPPTCRSPSSHAHAPSQLLGYTAPCALEFQRLRPHTACDAVGSPRVPCMTGLTECAGSGGWAPRTPAGRRRRAAARATVSRLAHAHNCSYPCERSGAVPRGQAAARAAACPAGAGAGRRARGHAGRVRPAGRSARRAAAPAQRLAAGGHRRRAGRRAPIRADPGAPAPAQQNPPNSHHNGQSLTACGRAM